MKKIFLYILTLICISCSSIPPEITQNDKNLKMIGGKEALLDAIIYPDFALENSIEGTVNIMAYIDTLGLVKECEVLSGNDFLNPAAIEAVQSQKFHPYYVNGKKSPVRVSFPISFSIKKEIDIKSLEEARLQPLAREYLGREIITLNHYPAERSPGKLNNYYSEGLTWWPDSKAADAPYIIIDGKVNPKAFISHKNALKQTSETIAGLTSLYLTTKNPVYAKRALKHINAWFLDENTAMIPDMKFAQSIPNRSKGRPTGIYEAMPLIEIIRSVDQLRAFMTKDEIKKFQQWLKDFNKFLVYDKFGIHLRAKKNIYATACLAQLVSIADFLEDEYLLITCREYFEKITLPYILSDDSPLIRPLDNQGLEYNLLSHADYLSVIANMLSDEYYDAWEKNDKNGRRLGDLINYIYSGLLNKRIDRGPHYKGRYISLYYAGKAYNNERYLNLWMKLQEDVGEIDFPLRNILLYE
ncbi:MAG: TonB family protein [Candidatus Neomarinimicrobiota bacterium]